MIGCSEENPLPSCNLLLSKKPDFLDNRLFRIPINPNEQGMKEEVLSSAGAQDLDNSACEVSNLDDFEFFWEKPQLEVVAVSGPVTGDLFLPAALENLERGE